MRWSMQLTWNEDATVLDDKDDDILLEEDIFMLELSWLEVIDEDCIEDADLKDDFCIWLPKVSLVSSWNVPNCLEELTKLDWDCSEAWVWEKLMLLPFCWKVLGFIQGRDALCFNVMHLCKAIILMKEILLDKLK